LKYYRIGICDDEEVFVEKIYCLVESNLIHLNCNFEINRFNDAKNLMLSNCEENYDIIFLDIDMPETNGIEAALTPGWYVYYSFSNFDAWCVKVDSSIYYGYPAILDINTMNVSAFPYNSDGHYVNVSGYNVYEDISTQKYEIRITDPWGPGLGNRWYSAADLYQANRNHFRSAIIW
jgi:hypothetical protein